MLEVKVKVKGPAIKLQGQWKFKGEIATTTQEEYDENAEYLEILKGKKEKLQGNVVPQKNGEDGEDKELEVLREKAKGLGIKGAHNMKKENLIAKIEEAEGTDNSEDTETKGENEEQPQ